MKIDDRNTPGLIGDETGSNLISHLSRDERFIRTDRGTCSFRVWGYKLVNKRLRSKRKR